MTSSEIHHFLLFSTRWQPLTIFLLPSPDTYVKLTMLDSKGKEMSRCKTSVCRGQPNPTYKETFVFQVRE